MCTLHSMWRVLVSPVAVCKLSSLSDVFVRPQRRMLGCLCAFHSEHVLQLVGGGGRKCLKSIWYGSTFDLSVFEPRGLNSCIASASGASFIDLLVCTKHPFYSHAHNRLSSLLYNTRMPICQRGCTVKRLLLSCKHTSDMLIPWA